MAASFAIREKLPQPVKSVLRPPVRAIRYLARLVRPSPFPLDVRLAWMAAGAEGDRFLARVNLISRCRRIDGEGEPYYRIGGKRLYYRPHFEVDEFELRQGIEMILRESYLAPEREPEEVRIRPGDVVLDLGGNIGTLAMRFEKQAGPRGRVYSFEPVMHHALSRNVRANRVRNVEVVPKAVADRSGEITFQVDGNCIDSRIAGGRPPRGEATDLPKPPVPRRGRSLELPVLVTTIDAWAAERDLPAVNVIKSDIEGAEELAMRGAEETVRRFRPRWMISSYHTDMQGERQHPKLVRLLQSWGYRIREVEGRRIYAW